MALTQKRIDIEGLISRTLKYTEIEENGIGVSTLFDELWYLDQACSSLDDTLAEAALDEAPSIGYISKKGKISKLQCDTKVLAEFPQIYIDEFKNVDDKFKVGIQDNAIGRLENIKMGGIHLSSGLMASYQKEVATFGNYIKEMKKKICEEEIFIDKNTENTNEEYSGYGFSVDEQQFVGDFIDKVYMYSENSYETDKKEEKVHYVFSVIAPLCVSYDARRWRIVCGVMTMEQAKEELHRIGFSDQEITDFQVLLNLQHGISIDEMSNYINTKGSKYNKKTVDDFDKCKDFAHEAIQYACFSNCDNTLSRMVGTVNGEYHQNVYINWECSFKGDIDSCKWGWNYQDEIIDMEKVDWSDFTSDIDAINIYYRMLTARDSLWSTIDNYNTGVANGEIKRASQFFYNIGNEDIEVGIIQMKNVVYGESLGGGWIEASNDPRKVEEGRKTFVRWIMRMYYDEIN